MPCGSKRNYESDTRDALAVAEQYHIQTRTVDLTPVREAAVAQISTATELNQAALSNLAPRLRMMTLYAIAASENRLVAGTGNRSEAYVGYFTKWGDGAYDFDPISDLTVKEVYEFLRFLEAPACVIEKAPSAGLFDGQTDEKELGFTYEELDAMLLGREISGDVWARIEVLHQKSGHKRQGGRVFAK